MKEDYLWDKTGEDGEIERLENVLRVFRAPETATPSVSFDPVQAKEEKPRRRKLFFLSPTFAFGATAMALMILVAGIWFRFPNQNLSVGDNLAKSITPEIDIEIPETAPESQSAISPTRNRQRPLLKKIRNPKSKTRNRINPKSEVPLTEEEKYAYNQLMLALSITSSKLKMVRDKVEGSESQKIITKQDEKTRRN
ncbi:MAG: hypothetical protein R2747_16750 [Pyrinomonadaceae bacterium]